MPQNTLLPYLWCFVAIFEGLLYLQYYDYTTGFLKDSVLLSKAYKIIVATYSSASHYSFLLAVSPLYHFFLALYDLAVKPQLMRPYSGNNLTKEKAIFNYRLSRAQRVVENAFGIMAAKWRILRQPIIVKTENVDKIVKAIGVLHNYMREKEGKDTVLEEDVENGLNNVVGRLGANMYTTAAEAVRGSFIEYFNSHREDSHTNTV